MPRKKNPREKIVADHKCHRCSGILRVVKVIPKAVQLPELRTYRCDGCGWLRTVENESELLFIAA